MKNRVLLSAVIWMAIVLPALSQTTIYSTSFGSTVAMPAAGTNPAGWTFTGIGMNISSQTTSSGYTGASGGEYLGEGNSVAFTNTSGTAESTSPTGTSTATLLVSTSGFSNILVSFGMRKSSAGYNSNATYSLSWSADNLNYTVINYTEATAGAWGLATGTGLTLPAGAENKPNLYIRWTFVRTGTASNFKIDDFSLRGLSCSMPSNPSASNNGPVCSGSSLILNASATGATSYSWIGPNGFFSGMQNPVIGNVTAAAAGTYTVTASNACGTVTANTLANINPSPNVYQVTGGGSYCNGGTGVPVGLNNSTTGVNYQLKNGSVNVGVAMPGTTGNAISFGSIMGAGTYSVLAIDTVNFCTTPMTGNAVISVMPSVTPSININASPGNTVCGGTTVAFTASPVNGGSAPMFQWQLNGINVGINSASYSNASLSDGDQIACVLTSNAVCATSPTANSNTIVIHVVTSTTPAVSIVSATGNVNCVGTNLTFTATPVNGGASPSYQWKLDGQDVGANSNSYSNNTLTDQQVVSCVMTSNDPCASPQTASSNNLTMTVNPHVTPSVSIEPTSGNSNCAGVNVLFTATPGQGGASPVYQWQLNGNPVGSNSSSYSNNSLSNQDTISCLMTSSDLCASPGNATSNKLGMTVQSAPPQPGIFSVKSTFVYQGQTGVSYAVPNVSGVTYNWTYTGTGATINGSGSSINVDYSSSATSGNLSVTANNNCGPGTARTIAIALNTPIPIPASNFDYSFVTVGCNRVDYLDTTFTTGDPDYACGTSTANVYQLKRLFTEIAHLNPMPKYLFMTGDIVMGYINDTVALAKQLNGWRDIYEKHPLSATGIILVAIPGNHETEDKANGKKSFVAAERTFMRVMAPYIVGSNGPGKGGPDGLATDQSRLTYSFDHGSDHFIIIDTDPVGKDGITPYKWIASDIQAARANNARHIFAFGHKPGYSSPYSPQGGLDAPATVAQRDSLWKYLEANNCEAMFSAHQHLWDSIHPHAGKTWQVINGNGGTRVETIWTGAGKQYYGYTLVNLYKDRKVNVMGLGRNTGMGTTAGALPYPINEDANATTIRNNFNICLSTASSKTLTACDSYTWGGIVRTTSGTYTYTTTNVTGCDSLATLILTIKPSPQITAVSAKTPICSGDSLLLKSVAAGSPTLYNWTGPNSFSSNLQNPFISNSAASATGTYTLTVSNSCGIVSSTVDATVSDPPVAVITPSGNTTFCAGDSVVLTATPGMSSYSWSNGATTQSIVVKSAGNYLVALKNSSGCSATSMFTTVATHKLTSDFNSDGVTDIHDFQLFVAEFGMFCTCQQDMNGDGVVNINDFRLFIGQFDQACH
jgi:hypothetical protein